MLKEIIKKELNKYFKTLPLDPYSIVVDYDSNSSEKSIVMWVVYHEFENEPKKGYIIAYKEIDKSWHVVEWVNDHYEHVCGGVKNFAEALKNM